MRGLLGTLIERLIRHSPFTHNDEFRGMVPDREGQWINAAELEAALATLPQEQQELWRLEGALMLADAANKALDERNDMLFAKLAALQAILDAFDAGQEAALKGQPRESNPHDPGDSYGVPTITQVWDDGYTCCINKRLQAENAELRAKLAASPPAQEHGWQPIATVAPLDDSTLILLCVQGANRSWFGTSMSRGQATHWMPLPHPLA